MKPKKTKISTADLTPPENLAELRARAEESLASRRDARKKVEQRIEVQFDQLSEQLAEELERRQQEIEQQARAEVGAERDEFEQQRDEWEKVCGEVERELASREQQLTEREQAIQQATAVVKQERLDLDRWAGELADERLAIEAARRDAEQAGGGQDEAAIAAAREEAEKAGAERDELAEQLAEAERTSAAAAAAFEANIDKLTQQLNESQTGSGGADPELQNKLEHAQSDAARLRQRVEELELQAAERPAAGGDEEVEDLRRRFEMAVEDVRQLKNEKAELEQQLSSAGGAAASSEGLDWETQKRRMLAALEGEAVTDDTERQEERVTIEGTVRITDEVVAARDRRIAELEQQLANAPEQAPEPAAEAAPAEASADLNPLSDDERFEAERERLASLEQQWQDKLRAAELELSVERAKIAREQAELAEWRIELESMSESPGDSETGDKKGQRRWLDKLGLNGNE